MSDKKMKISIVIPVYRSAESLPILVQRIISVMTDTEREYEVILVDDFSPDNSWEVLKSLKHQYRNHLIIIRLCTNSGQHNAILCGFSQVTGDIVITMDDDLQNPPEEIPNLVKAVDTGYDLVIGEYDSKKHGGMRNSMGGMIDTLQRWMFKLPSNFQLTSFRAIKRSVVDLVRQMGGTFPYITCMLFSNAASYVNVLVRHEPRRFGHSNYNIKRSLLLAANLLISYSPYPIYLVGFLCALAFLFCAMFGIITLLEVLLHGTSVPGWASTVLIVTGFNAITLLALLIALIYIVRINQQITRTRIGYAISEMYE
jgi:polyisoprenyl-phosphate glycosyltransferase